MSPAICYRPGVFSVDLLLLHVFAVLLLSHASLCVLVMSLNGEGDKLFFLGIPLYQEKKEFISNLSHCCYM